MDCMYDLTCGLERTYVQINIQDKEPHSIIKLVLHGNWSAVGVLVRWPYFDGIPFIHVFFMGGS